jgi:hypothetical protein
MRLLFQHLVAVAGQLVALAQHGFKLGDTVSGLSCAHNSRF